MKRHFNWIEVGLIGVVSIISLYFFISGFGGEISLLLLTIDLIAAITGIFSVVLCAKGKKSGFVFGLINVVFYSILSFTNQYYGEVMLNVLFYVPINIIAYINWSNNYHEQKKEVKARKLTFKQIAVMAIAVCIITYCYHLLLIQLGGAQTLLDGTTTVLSIVASILMARRYAEQWICWIIVDIITVAMWIIAGNPTMIAMWSAYLINAFYGYVLWIRKSK